MGTMEPPRHHQHERRAPVSVSHIKVPGDGEEVIKSTSMSLRESHWRFVIMVLGGVIAFVGAWWSVHSYFAPLAMQPVVDHAVERSEAVLKMQATDERLQQ